tara:strand:+ start:27 stop:359 length:333 start_codon:yes stop_codon:yes gene_type:complete
VQVVDKIQMVQIQLLLILFFQWLLTVVVKVPLTQVVLEAQEEAEVLLLMLEVQEIHRRQDLVDHKVILEVQEVHNQTHPLQVAAVEAEDQEVLVLPVQEMLEALEVQALI